MVPLFGLCLFAGTILLVLVAVEAGYRLGKTGQRRVEGEQVPSVASAVGATLSLLAFMLAITFGMVANRFEARKTLVRDEANAIRTVWFRTDLLSDRERDESTGLLRQYVEVRLNAILSGDLGKVNEVLAESAGFQRRLWDLAIGFARREMNSPSAALYLESLNEMFRLHALRVAIGLQARIPVIIWVVLYSLIVLSMVTVGFHIAVAGSGHSRVTPILALSFSIVIALIALLDYPGSGVVSQRPLEDLLALMADAQEPGPVLNAVPESKSAPNSMAE